MREVENHERPPVDYIARTREQYDGLGYAPYRWVDNDGQAPFTRPSKPLAESRVALVASGGVYVAGQVAFHFRDDLSFRVVPSDVDVADLRTTHFAYDLTDARRDPNVVFPIEPLRDLVEAGELGGLGPNAYAFMGGIYSSRRVRDQLAPAIADRIVADQVDLVLLVPV
jgi:D-proline reductase (dithiol) PrdB